MVFSHNSHLSTGWLSFSSESHPSATVKSVFDSAINGPGDRAHKVRAQSEKRGVYLDDGLWDDLQKLAAESRKEKVS